MYKQNSKKNHFLPKRKGANKIIWLKLIFVNTILIVEIFDNYTRQENNLSNGPSVQQISYETG